MANGRDKAQIEFTVLPFAPQPRGRHVTGPTAVAVRFRCHHCHCHHPPPPSSLLYIYIYTHISSLLLPLISSTENHHLFRSPVPEMSVLERPMACIRWRRDHGHFYNGEGLSSVTTQASRVEDFQDLVASRAPSRLTKSETPTTNLPLKVIIARVFKLSLKRMKFSIFKHLFIFSTKVLSSSTIYFRKIQEEKNLKFSDVVNNHIPFITKNSL